MEHDIREAKGSEKKRSGFELTAAECSKSALVVRVNEHELELPTVVQVINNNLDVIQYVVLKVHDIIKLTVYAVSFFVVSWRKHNSFVTQSPLLFPTSVRIIVHIIRNGRTTGCRN